MKARRNYKDESEKLAKAIDIAIDAFNKYRPEKETINGYEMWKTMALNPEPPYKKLASLNYLIEYVFTYFQEGGGEIVEYFWKRIAEEELDYKRENKLQKILYQGKIKSRIQYEYIQDIFVVAQQEGMISPAQADQLAQMLERYESGNKKRIKK
jgi:hypothetical protein